MALTTRVLLKIGAQHTNPLDLGTAIFPLDLSYLLTLANGTGAGEADAIVSDERTLSSGAAEDLDFAGALTDAFGNTVTFAKIKLVAFFADAGNTTRLTVTADADAPLPLFSDAEEGLASIGPNGFFVIADPGADGICAVTADSGDKITIENAAGGAAKYRIVVIGTAAS